MLGVPLWVTDYAKRTYKGHNRSGHDLDSTCSVTANTTHTHIKHTHTHIKHMHTQSIRELREKAYEEPQKHNTVAVTWVIRLK